MTAPQAPPAPAPSSATAEVVDLDVVIVSYRCRDLVTRAVGAVARSIEAHTGTITVVDNDSRDGTTERLRAEHPDARVIEMGTNAGFSRANNRGIAAGQGRHVLILNPDTEVQPGALDELVAFADAHPAAGVVAPKLLNADGTDQNTARSFPTASAAVFGRRSPLTRLFPRNRWSTRFLTGRDHRGDDPFRVDWVSGACMLVPRKVVDTVGGFDEAFFLYWEDADWCRRIVDAGFEVWCVPTARVTHDEGGTRGHGWPTPIVRHFHTGAYRYWVKHHAPQPWNPLRWLAAGGLAARAIAIVIRGRLSGGAP